MLAGKSPITFKTLADVSWLQIMAMIPGFGQELRQTSTYFQKMWSAPSNLYYVKESLRITLLPKEDKPLIQAGKSGREALVRHEEPKTLLWLAADLNHPIFGLLLNDPQSLSDLDKPYKGRSPLRTAIDHGNFKVVGLILKQKAKTSSKLEFKDLLSKTLQSSLETTRKNRLETVQQILQFEEKETAEFCHADFLFPDQTNPFMLAASVGPLELVQMFSTQAANPRAKPASRLNALHLAARGTSYSSEIKQIEVLEWLLKNKECLQLDLEAKSNSGQTALHMAIGRKHAAAKFLIQSYNANIHGIININGRLVDILSLAIHNGRSAGESFLPFLDFLLTYLRECPNFNIQESLNRALWEAAGLHTKDSVNYETHVFTGEIIKKLLEAKVDPNIPNEIFEVVIRRKDRYYATAAAALVKHVVIKDSKQATQYLSVVCKMAYKSTSKELADIIKVLLEKGADMLASGALEHLTYHSSSEPLEVMVHALQTEKQYLKIKSLLILMPPSACGRFDINSAILIEALRGLPHVGNKLLDAVLSNKNSTDFKYGNFPKHKARLEKLSSNVTAIDNFKNDTLRNLIKKELQHLQDEEKLGKHTKITSKTEEKFYGQNKPVDERLQQLWNFKPKKLEIRAEKNVILALLVEYLRKPQGIDKKTEIDVLDIFELGVELADKRLSPEYAKTLRQLLLTPNGTPYLPFKFRSKMIEELQEGLKVFLQGLNPNEKYEFDMISNRIRQFLLIAPASNSKPPLPSISTHLLRASNSTPIAPPVAAQPLQNQEKRFLYMLRLAYTS